MTYHRIIKAIPINVLLEFDENKQKVVHLSYPILPVGTIVRLRYTPYKEKLNIKNKVFYYDFNLYVIIGHRGRKYILRELFAYIVLGPGLTAKEQVRVGRKTVTRLYQPYEVKEFDFKNDLMNYVRSALFRFQTITRHGGNDQPYWRILQFINDRTRDSDNDVVV
jgi:hypothetical protein